MDNNCELAKLEKKIIRSVRACVRVCVSVRAFSLSLSLSLLSLSPYISSNIISCNSRSQQMTAPASFSLSHRSFFPLSLSLSLSLSLVSSPCCSFLNGAFLKKKCMQLTHKSNLSLSHVLLQ